MSTFLGLVRRVASDSGARGRPSRALARFEAGAGGAQQVFADLAEGGGEVGGAIAEFGEARPGLAQSRGLYFDTCARHGGIVAYAGRAVSLGR